MQVYGMMVGFPRWPKVLSAAYLSTLLFACATTEKTAAPVVAPSRDWTHYTLALEPWEPGWGRLPAMSLVWINWYQGEELVAHKIGARAWDFNRDQSIDLLEILDASGGIESRAIDLDFSGLPRPLESVRNKPQVLGKP